MGKKKASRSRVLRPALKRAIREGYVFCRHQPFQPLIDYDGYQYSGQSVSSPGYERYQVSFGSDVHWWTTAGLLDCVNVPVEVKVFPDGNIDYQFVFPHSHVLARGHDVWFKQELEQIITMHRLGGYESALAAGPSNERNQVAQYIANAKKLGKTPRRRKNK